MSEKLTATHVTIQAQPIVLEDAIRLTQADGNGKKWFTHQDEVVGLGRIVTAEKRDSTKVEVIAEKELYYGRALLADKSQRALQSNANSIAQSMVRRFGDSTTQLYSEFASHSQMTNEGKERIVTLGGINSAVIALLSFHSAHALNQAKVGDFRIKINEDTLPKNSLDHDHYAVFGLGHGLGPDVTGGWMPFIELRGRALDIYDREREKGSNYQRALGAISFSEMATEYVAKRT